MCPSVLSYLCLGGPILSRRTLQKGGGGPSSERGRGRRESGRDKPLLRTRTGHRVRHLQELGEDVDPAQRLQEEGLDLGVVGLSRG